MITIVVGPQTHHAAAIAFPGSDLLIVDLRIEDLSIIMTGAVVPEIENMSLPLSVVLEAAIVLTIVMPHRLHHEKPATTESLSLVLPLLTSETEVVVAVEKEVVEAAMTTVATNTRTTLRLDENLTGSGKENETENVIVNRNVAHRNGVGMTDVTTTAETGTEITVLRRTATITSRIITRAHPGTGRKDLAGRKPTDG